jgi:hypothetical protein
MKDYRPRNNRNSNNNYYSESRSRETPSPCYDTSTAALAGQV